MVQGKTPADCRTIDEVRSEIDRLDRGIIEALVERRAYVHAILRFKNNEADVHATERQQQMLAQRRRWAEEAGLDPNLIERLFRTLVDHFVAEELALLRTLFEDG